MGKLSFLVGLGVGYVLGARAGKQRYQQIKATSARVWSSDPVQHQVSSAKEVARTRAVPAMTDKVSDVAKATGEKLRASKVVPGQVSDTPADETWAEATRAHDPQI